MRATRNAVGLFQTGSTSNTWWKRPTSSMHVVSIQIWPRWMMWNAGVFDSILSLARPGVPTTGERRYISQWGDPLCIVNNINRYGMLLPTMNLVRHVGGASRTCRTSGLPSWPTTGKHRRARRGACCASLVLGTNGNMS